MMHFFGAEGNALAKRRGPKALRELVWPYSSKAILLHANPGYASLLLSDLRLAKSLKQTVTRRADHKDGAPAVRIVARFLDTREGFQVKSSFWMKRSPAPSLRSSKSAKIWSKSFSAACFQTISVIRPFQ